MNVEDCLAGSALARFEPGMGLVDDVDAPLAAHDTAVLVASGMQFFEVTEAEAADQVAAKEIMISPRPKRFATICPRPTT